MRKENIIIIPLVFIGIAGFIWSGFLLFTGKTSLVQTEVKEESYKRALGAEVPEDICATPEGYTQEDWKDHMSHHPDRYKECL